MLHAELSPVLLRVGIESRNVSQPLFQVTLTCRAPLGTVTSCHPWTASRAPSDHAVHLALLGAFMLFIPKLQEEFPAVSCSPAMMIPHFQREEPEQCTHPPAFLWNCWHVGGPASSRLENPREACREAVGTISVCPSLVPFSRGSPSALIQRLIRQKREQLAGQRWDANGRGGMRRSRPGGMKSGLAHHGAVGRRFWISALPWD